MRTKQKKVKINNRQANKEKIEFDILVDHWKQNKNESKDKKEMRKFKNRCQFSKQGIYVNFVHVYTLNISNHKLKSKLWLEVAQFQVQTSWKIPQVFAQ